MPLLRMLVLAAALILVVIGCGPVPTTSFTPTPTASVTPTRLPTATLTRPPLPLSATSTPVPAIKVLRIGHTIFPDVLDPAKASSNTEIEVLRLSYEGLVTVDEKGNVQPGAADKWELSKDETQMTFHIRDGLKRLDGTPITAADFAYALKRTLDPRVPDRVNGPLLYDIKGAQDLDQIDPTTAKPEDVDKAISALGVQATGDRTLLITFKKPIGYWQSLAGSLATLPVDKKQVDQDPDAWWAKPVAHNGNGPFIIRTLEQGKRLDLAPNPNYWRGKPKLDRIELLFYPNSNAVLEAYRKGDIDVDASITPENISAISEDANLAPDLLRYPAAILYAVGFNNAIKPFDDKNVRIAFSQALDREGWIRDSFQGIGKTYLRWIPPGVPGAQPLTHGVPGYDRRAAVLTLVNSGYAASDSTSENPRVDCDKLGEIKLTYVNSPLNQSRYQFLASDFNQVFNCEMKLDPVDYAAFKSLNKDVKTRPMIFFQGYLEDYAHPQNWLSAYWSCTSSFAGREGYRSKDLDNILTLADQESDSLKAMSLYQKAENMLIDDVPAAFSHHSENIYLVKPYVLGPRDHISSADIEWPGEWGPVWTYGVDTGQVPAGYPKQ